MFSSIWGNMCFFIRVFSFEMVFLFSGAALALCVPTFGAFLFLACWLPVRSSWVGFGLAGSGRAALGQGSFWLFFWVASLAPEMVTWILPKCTKTNGFRAIYAQRAARRIVACEPLCSESSCFLVCFCEFGGHFLVPNELVGAQLGVSLGVCSVLFRALCGFFLGALDWVVGWLAGSGWLAGWPWLAGWLAGSGWLADWLTGWVAGLPAGQ